MANQTIQKKKNNYSGLSKIDEPVFLVAARLRKPHSLSGEWALEIITDFPERLRKGKTVYVGEEKIPLTIKHTRGQIGRFIVAFKENITDTNILLLRNQFVYVKTSELPSLPEGNYYHHQILGMEVQDEQQQTIGRISEILETGANDVYVVQGDGKEILIPAIESVIIHIDAVKKVIVVKLPDWI